MREESVTGVLLLHAKRLSIAVSLAGAVAGCDRGSWVDVPTLCIMLEGMEKQGKEQNREAEAEKKILDFARLNGQGACGQVGKSYTGDYDCDGDHSRVKCE
jgi:hypothetical protein